MSNELLLSVAACPGLLADWCGPARDDQGREVMCTGAVERVGTENGLSAFVMDANTGVRWWAPLATLSLDLSRAECRDRVARQTFDDPCPVCIAVDEDGVMLWHGGVPVAAADEDSARMFAVPHVSALAALDPNDDRRLPGGSRWVDARALLLVAQHVGGGQ